MADAARMLTYKAAWLKDHDRPFKREAAIAKLYATEAAVTATRMATQIFGGYGFMDETPVSRFYRDAKVLEIGEGTSEIQRLVIARARPPGDLTLSLRSLRLEVEREGVHEKRCPVGAGPSSNSVPEVRRRSCRQSHLGADHAVGCGRRSVSTASRPWARRSSAIHSPTRTWCASRTAPRRTPRSGTCRRRGCRRTSRSTDARCRHDAAPRIARA